MAPPGTVAAADTDAGTDRGQLLVIIALLLGLLFVALAVVVNGAVFSENLATRETVDSERSTAYTAGIEDAVASRYDRTNANGSRTADDAARTFDEDLSTWTDQRAATAATEGAAFESDWTVHPGWRLEQSADDAFVPADDATATDWTVAGDARNVSAFALNVTRTDLQAVTGTLSDAEDAFRLNVSDGTTVWELYVFDDANNDSVVVHEGDPTGHGSLGALLEDSGSCSRTTDRAVVDVRNATFNGTHCAALELPAGLSGDLSIRYENVRDDGAEHVNGTYTIVVNGSDAIATDGSGHPERFEAPSGGAPTATAVVYAVGYEADYRRGDVHHGRSGTYRDREEAH